MSVVGWGEVGCERYVCLWWGGGGVGDEREGVYGCRCGCVKEND